MTAATTSRSELMAAIRGVSAARDLPPEVIIDALKTALESAYRKLPGGSTANITVDLDDRAVRPRDEPRVPASWLRHQVEGRSAQPVP